jgi:hypothetical protein
MDFAALSRWPACESALVGKSTANRSLGGDGFHLGPQVTHNVRDASSRSYFSTAKIPCCLCVAAFGYLQGASAMFWGKRSNDFSYSWNRRKRDLQKAFLF